MPDASGAAATHAGEAHQSGGHAVPKPRPLEDVRIVAVEQYGAGPFGTMHLADLGAEVIKIEDPGSGGDVARTVPPFHHGDTSLFFETYNRSKRSIKLDIRNPQGRAVFEDLVGCSDAVFSNLRGDVPARLGLLYEDLKHANPRIVCCSLTGFGMTGPRADQPGYDYILQGLCGWMAITGEPDGPPTKSGLSLVDFSGGLVAAVALMVGIHAARRDGVGMDCDLSLFDTALTLLGYLGTWHLTGGFEPQRVAESGHPSLVPFGAIRASDSWMVIGCAKEKFWQRLTVVIGRPELATDERFNSFSARFENKEELLTILRDCFATRTAQQWIEDLEAAGVPCGPIQDVPQALRDPHTKARGLLVELEHPHFGTVRSPVTPVRIGEHPKAADMACAPVLDADADHVLRELLGYDTSRIDSLRAAGACG